MTREIKFRVWDKEQKKMLSSLWLSGDGIQSGTSLDLESFTNDLYNEVLMQFTGLKDKNDKEIYESDIIKYCFWSDCNTNPKREWKEGIIFWNDKKLCWDIEGTINGIYGTPKYYEIIGNIYENSDLLK